MNTCLSRSTHLALASLVILGFAGCGGGGGPAPTYTISGSVTDLSTGKSLEGVTIALSGVGSTSSSTDASGNFVATGLPDGTYRLTPSMGQFTFMPASASVTIGGSDRSGANFTRQSFVISGHVTNALTGTPREQVSVAVSGPISATTSTDANGQYSVAELPNGSYSVSAAATGVLIKPSLLGVTINGANTSGQDFLAAVEKTIATGISFLPASKTSADPILHTSLTVRGGSVFFSDASATPVKKVSLSSLAVTPLVTRMSALPEGAVIYGQLIYWRDGDSLYQSSLDGAATTVLVTGLRNPVADNFSADLVVDASAVYFANVESYPNCSGACPWYLESVPRSGGSPVVLASTTRRVVALSADAANVYWEEASLEPVAVGCMCGSSISRVAKTGGPVTQIVDGLLNAPPPNLGPGYLPGSWMPAGGITVDSSQLYFGVSGYYGLTGYQVSSVPIAGGAVTAIASVPSSAIDALNAIRTVSVNGGTVYWIDMVAGTLYAVPATGGVPTALASVAVTDMAHSGSLAIAAGRAFWTEPGTYTGCCLTAGSGSIRSVSLSGGATSLVYGNLDTPTWLTTDGAVLAWTESWRLARSAATGGVANSVVAGIATNAPRVITDDNFVYVLDGDFVKKVPVNGGQVERVAAARANMGDVSVHDGDMTSDGTNLYWTVTDMFSNSVVFTAPVGGGATTLLATPVAGLLGGANLSQCFGRIAVDAQYVYWMSASATISGGCSVDRAPLAGGAGQVLADSGDLQDFTMDISHLYIAGARSAIQQMPLSGGPGTVFSTGRASRLINDAAILYWLDGGELWMQPKSASGATVDPTRVPVAVATQPALAVEALVGDQNGIYLTSTIAGEVYLVQ